MEGKSKKDIINTIKGILPAVFCIVLAVVAVHTGGADIRKLPVRVKAGFETQAPDIKQEKAAEVQVLSGKKEKTVKKKKKAAKTENKKSSVNIENLEDGTFTGVGTGFGGDIKSSVTIKDGKITDIKILSAAGETPSYFDKAKAVISLIIDKQACNVDSVSGATYSSNGIIESVKNALRLAKGKKVIKKKNNVSGVKKKEQSSGDAENKNKNEKNKKTSKNGTGKPAGTSNLKDGLYTGTGTGFGGEIKVNVKIKKGKITKISILSAEFETPSYFDKAKSIINTMIKKQSAEVDVITGATYSSNGIKEAVNNALLKAVKKKEQNTDKTNRDNGSKDNTNNNNDGEDGNGSSSNSGDTDVNNNDGNNTDNNGEDENGEWILVSKTSNDYTYPVITYCEPYTDDFEGYDIGFNIIITTEITVEENAVKSIRTTTNNYVSSVEFEQDTIDYVMKTGNWAFLDMAANGTGTKIGLFGQLVSNNSVESFDTVSGATCSSDALEYGIKTTLDNITLGKTVAIN